MNFGNLELGCALESVMWLQAVLWILHNAFFLPQKKKKNYLFTRKKEDNYFMKLERKLLKTFILYKHSISHMPLSKRAFNLHGPVLDKRESLIDELE